MRNKIENWKSVWLGFQPYLTILPGNSICMNRISIRFPIAESGPDKLREHRRRQWRRRCLHRRPLPMIDQSLPRTPRYTLFLRVSLLLNSWYLLLGFFDFDFDPVLICISSVFVSTPLVLIIEWSVFEYGNEFIAILCGCWDKWRLSCIIRGVVRFFAFPAFQCRLSFFQCLVLLVMQICADCCFDQIFNMDDNSSSLTSLTLFWTRMCRDFILLLNQIRKW